MLTLDINNIRLNAHASGKVEAIEKVGQLLIDSEIIENGYINSMMEREKVANTYLGNGIAIPHGLPKHRDLIKKTGIAVLQLPEGVEWNPGEKVYLVVGIAARSDEHIEILTNLTGVLDDEKAIALLSKTTDMNQIAETLAGKGTHEQEETTGPDDSDYSKSAEMEVTGAHGLHARPATAFVETAKQYASRVIVRYEQKTADGKSLVSLLKLGVPAQGRITILVKGEDEDEALSALVRALTNSIQEEKEEEIAEEEAWGHNWKPSKTDSAIPGISASPGLAIGPLKLFQKRKVVVEATAKDPVVEKKKLDQAIANAQAELNHLYEEVKGRSGVGKAAIFKAHLEFLSDHDLIDEAVLRINKGGSAGWSWQQSILSRVKSMKGLDNELLAARATDLDDVGARVLRLLAGVAEEELFQPEKPVILVAEDLTPSDTAGLDPSLILGFCTAGGGPSSHTAIIARSLGIPAVVGAGPAVLHQDEGTFSVLDGDGGVLYVDPTDKDIESAMQAQEVLREKRNEEHAVRFQPAMTTDGERIEVVANIGKDGEAGQAVNNGGEGVGLLRTEFLFLERNEPPNEEEQYRIYLEMVKSLNGLPLIVRTLDIGGDKEVPYLNLPKEDNPFLGVRGIRLCLTQMDLFKTQLRAVFRASQHGPVKIMFPMISTLEDLETAKEITEEVRQKIGADPVEIGIMIEVPSAVAMAEELAKSVDFFSVGTNDLTQYTLAIDRMHPLLSKQADGLHPAILRMIDQTVRAANKAGIWVGVCGGMAADPKGAMILTGLGVKELSVSIPSIAAVKAQVRNFSMSDAKLIAEKALKCVNANQVRNL